MIKLGLFGFGRIGRSFLRQALKSDSFEVSFICDQNPSIDNIIYLLQYDCSYGRFDSPVLLTAPSTIATCGQEITYCSAADFDEDLLAEVDFVIDATGSDSVSEFLSTKSYDFDFRTIQTNASDITSPTIIVGVNDDLIGEFENCQKICSGTCDSTGIGTVLKAVEPLGEIVTGSITIMHPWSVYQNLLDAPSLMYSKKDTIYSNFALGRAAPGNLIPRKTSCVGVLERIFPSMKQKIHGMCIRVPTSNVCAAEINLFFNEKISKENVITVLQLSDQFSQGVLALHSEQLISSDFIGTHRNAHVDLNWIETDENGFVRLFAWYDNEWGYASNVLRLIQALS